MINLFKVAMNTNVSIELEKTINSGFITQGTKVEEFENKLKEKFNYKHILTLNSATSGLTLGLRLLKQKDMDNNWPGINESTDYVLSTPLTCFATNAAILANNLRIKWVDVDKNNCNIDLEDLEKKINYNTKVIYVVHWGGFPIDYEKLNNLLDRKEKELGFKPRVIEDCAHAMGSKYNNKSVGTFGNIAVFSLQAIKHLVCGDGGLIFLPNEELYERAKLLRWYGIDRDKRNYKFKDLRMENDIVEWGYKFHMNDINATIGVENLKIIDNNLEKIRINSVFFNKHLMNLKKIRIINEPDNIKSSYWIYTLFCDNADIFIEFMKNKNITASQVHKRNDINSCLQDFKTTLPNLDDIQDNYVCIPCGFWLTELDKIYIFNSILEYDKI